MHSIVLLGLLLVLVTASPYPVDDTNGPARTLDGIGGLSGGGATSVFLPSYPTKQREEILDYLFKPNFGASLHILKVEIGGDAQSTDGAESSHMHNPWEENYERGYEWWLMAEAKKRNPDILLYGLAWAYPQWVTCAPGTMENCTNSIYTYPDVTARYVTKWISGAKNTYGLDIDYVGSWNERPYNTTYLKALRATLDEAGFPNTKIVAPDSSWDIAKDILADAALADAVYAIGAHYPGTTASSEAERTAKPLWASEDDSTYNNNVGAGCWARIINQNYVNGNMTASINWNLVAAYMKGTNWYRAGLMNAMQPWNGAYGSMNADGTWTAGPMIWASAHTTQFSQPKTWSYLHTGDGAGHLANGGSYVTLKNFATGDFSIVIEKMSRDHSSCVRPYLSNFATSPEVATFQLAGGIAKGITALRVWYTHWASYDGDVSSEFIRLADVAVVNGSFTLNISVDSMFTVTTLSTGNKGSYDIPPVPVLFPTSHSDDFESCPISSEAPYFTDQNGIWECVLSNDGNHGTVMRQMVPLKPVTWGGDIRPHTLIGHRDGKNSDLVFDAFIEEPGASVMLGLRMQGTDNSKGLLFTVDTSGAWGLWSSISSVGGLFPMEKGTTSPINPGTWNTYRGNVNGTTMSVWIGGQVVLDSYQLNAGDTRSGHALLGTASYGHFTQFDNFQLTTEYTTCGNTPLAPGANVSVVVCGAEVGPQPGSTWRFNAVPNNKASNSTISLRSRPDLCLTAVDSWLKLATCSTSDKNQLWSWSFDGIAPDVERSSFIYIAGTHSCLDIYNQQPDIGSPMDSYLCNLGANQAFFYDHDAGEIGNEAMSTCLGVC